MVAKLIGGIVIILIGAWLLLPLPTGIPYQGVGWEEFLTVLVGVVPVGLIFLGLLIAWIDWEDMRAAAAAKKK